MHEQCGVVGPGFAEGLGGEVGGVGFDEQSVEGDFFCGVSAGVGGWEGDDSGEGDVEAAVDKFGDEFWWAGVAVE